MLTTDESIRDESMQMDGIVKGLDEGLEVGRRAGE
jgi:hypothetical protein